MLQLQLTHHCLQVINLLCFVLFIPFFFLFCCLTLQQTLKCVPLLSQVYISLFYSIHHSDGSGMNFFLYYIQLFPTIVGGLDMSQPGYTEFLVLGLWVFWDLSAS